MPPTRKPKKRRAYHHGDLKEALVERAIHLLRTEGPDALTLRGVARAAGVSQAAPYRHFASRRELVGAVAEDGFRRLKKTMLEHVGGKGGRDALKGVAAAYVAFGMKNPAQYRIMFGPELATTADLPSLRATSRDVLGFVAEGVRGLQSAGLVGKGDAASIAVVLWATLHGLVLLTLDGVTNNVAPSLDTLLGEATRIMMFGMAPRVVTRP
jgi:AcrR family transcriptional regulator